MTVRKPRMANSRLLNKQISLSEKVADLPSDTCRLLYTWLIPHTDDFGVVEASPRKIKALVFPMNDCTVEDIGIQLESIEKAGLLTRFQYGGKEFFYMSGFTEKQTLKKDRQPQTILEFKLDEDREKNWKTGLEIVAGIQMDPNGIQTVPEIEEKGREDKIREDKENNDAKNSDEFSEIKEKLKIPEPNKSVQYEFQAQAVEIIEALGISEKRKSAYFKACKENPKGKVLSAYTFAVDYPNPQARDKMFFWKLNGGKNE